MEYVTGASVFTLLLVLGGIYGAYHYFKKEAAKREKPVTKTPKGDGRGRSENR